MRCVMPSKTTSEMSTIRLATLCESVQGLLGSLTATVLEKSDTVTVLAD